MESLWGFKTLMLARSPLSVVFPPRNRPAKMPSDILSLFPQSQTMSLFYSNPCMVSRFTQKNPESSHSLQSPT